MQLDLKIDKAKLLKIIIPLLAMGVGLALFPFVILPSYEDIKQLSAKNAEKQKEIDQLSQKSAFIVESKKDFEKLHQEFTTLDTIYPTQKQITSVILGLGKLASENNVTIIDFKSSPGEIVATASAKPATGSAQATTNISTINPNDSLALEFTSSGSLEDQKKFIAKLSEVRRLMFLNRVDVAAASDGQGYEAKVLLEIPYGGLPPKLPLAKDPITPVSAETENFIATYSAFPLYTAQF